MQYKIKIVLLLIVVAESSVEEVGPNPEPVIQSVSSSSHAPGTSVTNDGGGTTVGGTYTGVIKSSPV
jgi:hypothetical protein